jgi:hypothetical protein
MDSGLDEQNMILPDNAQFRQFQAPTLQPPI